MNNTSYNAGTKKTVGTGFNSITKKRKYSKREGKEILVKAIEYENYRH